MTNNGAHIGAFFLDEPLTSVWYGYVPGQWTDYAVAQTRWFIGQLRQNFPNAAIIEIEAYPFIPISVLLDWISALTASPGPVPDYFETDYDLNAYSEDPWSDMHNLQEWSHFCGIRYSLLMAYSGSGYSDQSDWYNAQYYQAVYYSYPPPWGIEIMTPDFSPDLYHISAFYHTPRTTADENQAYSFMYTVKSHLWDYR